METAITNTHTNTKEREESARPQFCFQPWHRLPSPQHTDICTWKRKQLAHKCSSNSWSHNYASNQCTSTEENVSTAVGSQQHRDGIFHGEGLPDNLLWVWPLLLQPPTMQTAAKQGEEMACDSSAWPTSHIKPLSRGGLRGIVIRKNMHPRLEQ